MDPIIGMLLRQVRKMSIRNRAILQIILALVLSNQIFFFSSGKALIDEFQLSCMDWKDPDDHSIS